MNIFHHLKKWYFDTFLPFENPEHPLYSDGSITYDDEMCQTISDFIDDELDAIDYDRINSMIGPNYLGPWVVNPLSTRSGEINGIRSLDYTSFEGFFLIVLYTYNGYRLYETG